jgi:hypothetical protein
LATKKKAKKKVIKKTKARKKPGFKKVSFFSGLSTETKLDDKQVSFVARNRGKDSLLPRPKKAKALRDLSSDMTFGGFDGGINIPKQKKEPTLPLGIAESSGISFDNVFGLGKQKKGGKGLFQSKIGIDNSFGKDGFDSDFSKAFSRSAFEENKFNNFPSMIEADFDDNPDIEGNVEAGLDDDVPSLLQSLPTIQNGSRALDEEDPDEEISKNDRLESKFLKIRSEALETGANPLGPEEAANFEITKATGNFGTTGKTGRRGTFGRF